MIKPLGALSLSSLSRPPVQEVGGPRAKRHPTVRKLKAATSTTRNGAESFSPRLPNGGYAGLVNATTSEALQVLSFLLGQSFISRLPPDTACRERGLRVDGLAGFVIQPWNPMPCD